MDPFTIALALALGGTLAVIAMVVTLQKIIEWFRSRGKIKEENAQAIAFSLAERINGRHYAEVGGVFSNSTAQTRIVQGFYDTATGQIIDARAMASKKLVQDEEVLRTHDEGDGLVIYT